MIARAIFALFALTAARALAQPQFIQVDVAPTDDPEPEDVEKRYTPELMEELESVKSDALLLYTEFTARASQSLKYFIKNISRWDDETRRSLAPGILERAPSSCRTEFELRLKKVKNNAYRAATFSGENHHKFLLGHMIVFKMHLNKSEEYVKRSEKSISTCHLGILCETKPKIQRWRRMAMDEMNRVRDDMQHSRRMYRDLLTHAQRKLNTLRRRLHTDASAATERLVECTKRWG